MRVVAYRKIQETLLVLVLEFKHFKIPGGTEPNPKPSQINKVLQPRDLYPLGTQTYLPDVGGTDIRLGLSAIHR
jgi:hypothetical protein